MELVLNVINMFFQPLRWALAMILWFFYVKLKIRWVDIFTLFFMGYLILIFLGYLGEGFLMFYVIYYMVLQNYISDLKNMRAKNIPFEKRNGEIWILIWVVFSGTLFALTLFFPNKYTVDSYMLFFPLAIVLYQFFWSKFMKEKKRNGRHDKLVNFINKNLGKNLSIRG